jgi:lysozyme
MSKARVAAVIGAGAVALLLPFVTKWEGSVPKTYRDPVGILTACVGHTGPELRMGQTWTPAECEEMLAGDLLTAARGVQDCVTEPLSDKELAAYTSFAFNVGTSAFCGSTAVVKLNAGDHVGACEELSRWIRARGQVLPGLVNRRAAEKSLCLAGAEGLVYLRQTAEPAGTAPAAGRR